MTVYADLAFILGALSGFLGIDLGLRFLDLDRSPCLRVVSSFLSGFLHCVSLLWGRGAFPIRAVWILFFFLVFRGRTLRGTVRNFATAAGLFLLWFGGVLFLLFAVFSVGLIPASSGVYFRATFLPTAVCFVLSYGILRGMIRIRRREKGSGRILNCVLVEAGRRIPLRCYEDSGNFLRDPTGDRPVVIAEYGRIRKALRDFPFPGSFAFAERFGPRFRVISCRFAAGEGQMMYGFAAEAFSVNGKAVSVTVCVSGSSLDGRGRFDGIIGNLLSEVDACDGTE